MPKFAIFSDILDSREDIPSIKLNKAISPESENFFLRYSTARMQKGRLKELTEALYDTGTVSTTIGSPTVTGVLTAWFSSATHFPAWGSDDLAAVTGRVMTIGVNSYTIKAVVSATEITLDTNALANESGASYSIGTSGQKVPAPDGDTIINYHRHIDSSSEEALFARTADQIFLWSSVWTAFIDKTPSGGLSDATVVTTRSFNGKVITTDGVNKVLAWDDTSSGSAFDELDTAG